MRTRGMVRNTNFLWSERTVGRFFFVFWFDSLNDAVAKEKIVTLHNL